MSLLRTAFSRTLAMSRPALLRQQQPRVAMQKMFASNLARSDVESRVLEIVKAFDKVSDPTKISATSSFQNDLGLDSLDTVEVVMAIEEEFSVEIPDKEADEIKSVGQAIDYIANHAEAR